ncbi:hypothetical protein MNV49_003391 [Pseudohyphozyma bogoriensis]|nr:hypothetical protein MNV49_003391 [Pseudohyphozyma bogoriensis]
MADSSTGLTGFLSRRKKTFAWIGGTVGGAYLLGRWGMGKIEEMAEKSRREKIEADNLSKRFQLNLQDCHFTVLALLPSLSSQMLEGMDVEAPEEGGKAEEAEGIKEEEEAPTTNGVTETKEEAAEQASEPATTTPAPAGADAPAAPQSQDPLSLSKSWAEVVATGTNEAKEVASVPETETAAGVPPPPEPAAPEPEPERTRAELWNDIKILSFTRTITSIYLLTLFTLQTHVQLNLLGRTAYVSSVLSSLPQSSSSSLSLPSQEDAERDLENAFGLGLGIDGAGKEEERKEVERKYLTFSWWVLNEGWKLVGERVRQAVEDVVGPMSLKGTLVYGELGTFFAQIRQRIDFDSDGRPHSFLPSLFPSTPQLELSTLSSGGIPASSLFIPPSLRHLLNETSDFLESHDCFLVQSQMLDSLFRHLVGALEAPFSRGAAGATTGSRFEDVTERKARLAGILPSLARQTHLVLNSSPNEYAEELEAVPELREFSAIIYSSFDKDNVRGR